MKHIKTPSKSNNLSIVAVLIVVAIFSYGIVRYEQHRKLADQLAAQAQAQKVAAANAQKEQLQALVDKLNLAKSRQLAVCSYVTTLSTAKATRSLVTVPAVPCTPVN